MPTRTSKRTVAIRPAAIDLAAVRLARGSHRTVEDGYCALELASVIGGLPFSDHPPTVSPVIGDFVRTWNDALDDTDRQRLTPYVPRLLGTKGTAAIERKRGWLALDWCCRVSVPAWLRLAGLITEAEAIEAAAPIVDSKSAQAAQAALDQARTAAYAAGDAAGDAAGTAAGDAAGDAAWAAAWAAARAAAWTAARAAAGAAAGGVLRPTVMQLQESAFALLDSLLAVGAAS